MHLDCKTLPAVEDGVSREEGAATPPTIGVAPAAPPAAMRLLKSA